MINHNTPQFSLKENYLIHQRTGPKKAPAIKSATESTENFKKDLQKDIRMLSVIRTHYNKDRRDRKAIAKSTKDILDKLLKFKEDKASPLAAIANKDILNKIIAGTDPTKDRKGNLITHLNDIPTITYNAKKDEVRVEDEDPLEKRDMNDLEGHGKVLDIKFKGEKIITTTREKYIGVKGIMHDREVINDIDKTNKSRKLIKAIKEGFIKEAKDNLKKAKKDGDTKKIAKAEAELEKAKIDAMQHPSTQDRIVRLEYEIDQALRGLHGMLGDHLSKPIASIFAQWEEARGVTKGTRGFGVEEEDKKEFEGLLEDKDPKDMPIITKNGPQKRIVKAKTAEKGAEAICFSPEDESLDPKAPKTAPVGKTRSYYVTTFTIEYKGEILKGTYVHGHKYLTYKTDNKKSDRSTNKAIAKSKKAMETKANAAETAKVLNDRANDDAILARAKKIEEQRQAAAKAKKAAAEAAAAKEKKAAAAAAVKAKKEAEGAAKKAAEDDKTAKVAMKTPEEKTGK